MKKKLTIIIFIFLLLFLGFVVSTFFVIYQGVVGNCRQAQNKYHLNCREFLIALIKDEKNTFKSRNHAIWALGQLADKKSAPYLRTLQSTLPPQEKCAQDKYLCRFEIEKALNWSQNGNITSWMYSGFKQQ